MGLAGMFIIEPNRPRNLFGTWSSAPGASRIWRRGDDRAGYQREYSLVYMDIDDRLNRDPGRLPRIPARSSGACIATTTRRSAIPTSSSSTAARFPFTLRDTPIEVKSGERVKLRILNAGARTIYLHTHGHHPILTHLDGYPVPAGGAHARDVVDDRAGPARGSRAAAGARIGTRSGPGVWLMHDHTEQATTNNGHQPGRRPHDDRL